jgi:lipopolysaccharide/colanic/teichoic acid biosynthesis glycosyltransferase
MDIAYIESRSLWLDIQILVHTVTAVLKQRGAH